MFLMPFYAAGPFELTDFPELTFTPCIFPMCLSFLLHVLFGKLLLIFNYIIINYIIIQDFSKFWNFKKLVLPLQDIYPWITKLSTLSCFTGWGFGIFYHKRNFSDYKS